MVPWSFQQIKLQCLPIILAQQSPKLSQALQGAYNLMQTRMYTCSDPIFGESWQKSGCVRCGGCVHVQDWVSLLNQASMAKMPLHAERYSLVKMPTMMRKCQCQCRNQ